MMRFPSIIAVLALLTVVGCSRKMPPPLPSPDGSLTLVTSVEHSRADPQTYLCVVFEIRDTSGKVVHRENTRASDNSRWKMSWVSADRIQLKSSDVGTYYWTSQPDGTWKKDMDGKSTKRLR
jgi:hypothetical protein